MKLIVFSKAKLLQKEHEIINALFEAGMLCFHLRKPEVGEEKIERLLKNIKTKFHKKVVLHRHYSLAFRYQLGGIHLPAYGRKALSPSAFSDLLYKLQARHMSISTSVHEKNMLLKIDRRFDYVFYSPVFPSISKPGYKPKENMDINSVNLKVQVFGLGGVEERNIDHLLKMGYQGGAVLGAIWNRPGHAVDHFKQIQWICQNSDLLC